MSSTFEFKAPILWLHLSGSVTSEEVMRLLADMEQEEDRHRPAPHRITDLTEITAAQFGFQEIQEVIFARRSKRFPNPFKSAIVASNDFQLAFARMFQTLNTNPQITIRIFPSREPALAWISE